MSLMLISEIRSSIAAMLFYARYKPAPEKKEGAGKVLLMDIRDNPYGRYLYCFLKFFHLEGYTIYMPKSLTLMRRLRSDHLAAHLLKEKMVHFGAPSAARAILRIDDKKISPDYFSESDLAPSRVLYVPMSQHPLMYYNSWWNTPLDKGIRKKSLFMAGNFDQAIYTRLETEQVFPVMSRRAVYDLLRKKQLLLEVENKDSMLSFLESNEDKKIILVDRQHFDIPMWDLRRLLSKFDFFFALPGVIMPFSHNVVEAMSAGSIPFIQEAYAAMFVPALENEVNAFTFKDHHDLEARLRKLPDLPPEKISFMREQVFAYYDTYLTPSSLVKNLEMNGHDKIFLQAEGESVKIFKHRLSHERQH